MDLGTLVDDAKFLALQLVDMGGDNAWIDPPSLLSRAHSLNATWQVNPDWQRAAYASLELLERQGLVEYPHPGAATLTELGRQLLPRFQSWNPELDDPATQAWIETQELVARLDERRPGEGVRISRLTVHNWRQFREVDIVMHPRLTILTGANAVGKTTLLNLLAPHFNWGAQLVSHSRKDQTSLPVSVATIQYSNGVRGTLGENRPSGISVMGVGWSNMQTVPGVFISSHRSMSSYRHLDNIPAKFSTSEALLQEFASEIQTRYSGGSSQSPPLYRMKQALVSAAFHGYGNQVVRQVPEALQVWEGFHEVLTRFLPASLNFEKLVIDNGEVIVRTSTGEFPVEAASGGISAMLELAWQIFLRSRGSSVFTVCIDEPENHLHPELQRTIIPALLDAFPHATFVVATHSPFVVTSTPDAHIYALAPTKNPDGVVARLLGRVNASATADETLESVLGLDSSLPLWAQRELEGALADLPDDPSQADLVSLRERLASIGLSGQFPGAIAAIGSDKN